MSVPELYLLSGNPAQYAVEAGLNMSKMAGGCCMVEDWVFDILHSADHSNVINAADADPAARHTHKSPTERFIENFLRCKNDAQYRASVLSVLRLAGRDEMVVYMLKEEVDEERS